MEKTKLYFTKRWIKIRENHLWDFPLCAVCGTTVGLQVDHIIEHKGEEELFWDPDNLQTLCISCHGKKSSLENTIQFLPTGTYTLKLSSDVNAELARYVEYFGNIKLAIQTYCKELTKNHVYYELKVGGLSLSVIRELVSYFVINCKFKPKNFVVDSSCKYHNLLSRLHF